MRGLDRCIPTRCVGARLGSHCFQSGAGAFAGEPPTTDPAEILGNPRFSPCLKKERSFSIPAVLNQQKSLRKAQTSGRKRLAGLRARGHSAAIVLRAPGGRERTRGTPALPWRPGNPGPLRKQLPGTFPLRTPSPAPHGRPPVGFTPVFSGCDCGCCDGGVRCSGSLLRPFCLGCPSQKPSTRRPEDTRSGPSCAKKIRGLDQAIVLVTDPPVWGGRPRHSQPPCSAPPPPSPPQGHY